MKTLSSLKYILFTLFVVIGANSYSQMNACILYPSADTAICKGVAINLIGNNCGTPVADDYYWTNLSDMSGTTYGGKTIAVRDTGVWELTLVNTFDNSEDKATVHVTFKSPKFEINNNALFAGRCSYSSAILNATTAAGITNYNWYKEGSGTSISTATSITISTLPVNSNYYVTANHALSGCALRDTIFVLNFEEPTPQLGNDTALCVGQNLNLSVKNLVGPLANYEFAWQSGPFGPTNSYNVTTTNRYKVVVKGPYPSPCIAVDSIDVTFNPNPTINALAPTYICYGNNIILSPLIGGAAGPYTFAWTPNDGTLNNTTIQSPQANPTTSTTYNVLVKVAATGCSVTGTRVVNVYPDLISSVTFADTTVCPGATVQLQGNASGGTPGYTYSWIGGTSATNTLNVSPTVATTYWFKVKDAQNCIDSSFINTDILWVDLGDADTLALSGDSVKLDAWNASTSGYTYLWKDALGTNLGSTSYFYAKTPGTYTVEISNGACMVSDVREVIFVTEIIQKVYIPTAFNPGMSEADNSHLRVYGNNISNENFNFRIYSNWGELVYETNSFTEANTKGWNGTLKNTGQALNMGVYTYAVRGQFYDGSTFETSGTSSLIR